MLLSFSTWVSSFNELILFLCIGTFLYRKVLCFQKVQKRDTGKNELMYINVYFRNQDTEAATGGVL